MEVLMMIVFIWIVIAVIREFIGGSGGSGGDCPTCGAVYHDDPWNAPGGWRGGGNTRYAYRKSAWLREHERMHRR